MTTHELQPADSERSRRMNKRTVTRRGVAWQQYQRLWINEVVRIDHANGTTSFYLVDQDRGHHKVSESMFDLFDVVEA